MIGTVLSGYQVIEKIKDGSVGTVWKGRNSFNEDVALKVLAAHHAATGKKLKDFRNEAKITAQLKHPGIIRILKFVDVLPQPYVIMEYFNSENLKFALMNLPDRIRGREFRILKEIAEVLHAMHRQGVVHLDIKPENVLISATSSIRLIDFSIAQSSWGRMFKFGKSNWGGTPAYMAPEQIRGEAVSPATDQYAFGILAYELFAKRTPFLASTQNALLEKHLTESPPPLRKLLPKTPPDVDRVLLRMLEKDPAARWADMAAVAYELGKLSDKWGVWWVDPGASATSRTSAHTARLSMPTTPPTSGVLTRPQVRTDDLSLRKTHPIPTAKEFRVAETDTVKAAAPVKAVPAAKEKTVVVVKKAVPALTDMKPPPKEERKASGPVPPVVAAVAAPPPPAAKPPSSRVPVVAAPEAKPETSRTIPDLAPAAAEAKTAEAPVEEAKAAAPAAALSGPAEPVPPFTTIVAAFAGALPPVPEIVKPATPAAEPPALSGSTLTDKVDEVEALLQDRLNRRLEEERKRKQKVAEEGVPSEPLPRNAPHESDMNLPTVR